MQNSGYSNDFLPGQSSGSNPYHVAGQIYPLVVKIMEILFFNFFFLFFIEMLFKAYLVEKMTKFTELSTIIKKYPLKTEKYS